MDDHGSHVDERCAIMDASSSCSFSSALGVGQAMCSSASSTNWGGEWEVSGR
jgi:hypothetical protein